MVAGLILFMVQETSCVWLATSMEMVGRSWRF